MRPKPSEPDQTSCRENAAALHSGATAPRPSATRMYIDFSASGAGPADGWPTLPGVGSAAMPADDPSCQAGPTAFSRLSTRALEALQAGPPWITFLVGVGITTDFRYLTALTVILASGPLWAPSSARPRRKSSWDWRLPNCHLSANWRRPHGPAMRCRACTDWVQARRRAVLGVIVAALGVFLMTTGMGHV